MDQGLIKLAELPCLSGWFCFTYEGEPERIGHRPGFIGWEFAVFQYNKKSLDIEGLKDLLITKLGTSPTAQDKNSRFFVGNFYNKVKRNVFQTFDLYYPSTRTALAERNCLLWARSRWITR